MKPNQTLPTPSEDAQAKSQELSKKIRQRIKRHGALPFSDYMQMALYTPGLGYYTSGLPKIGATGDFITAPEVSPIFSRCLARQSVQVLDTLEQRNIIEFGAGKGTMAKDLLLELIALDEALEHYYIVELSADLRLRQQETLEAALPEDWFTKVIWLDELPKQPMQAVILGNEILDAMPVEKLRLEQEQSLRGFVQYDDEKDAFDWDYHPITESELQPYANGILSQIGEPTVHGYETEVNLNIDPWLQSIADFLEKGLILLIDYGYSRMEYYQPARHMGTLRCHYQHLAHSNPFYFPGLQDITAHVDFTAVAEGAYDAGFKVAGFTTQAHFLMGSGLLEMSGDPTQDITQSLQIAQQIKTLTLPNEMGESFKVIALTKDTDLSLMGFQLRDLRRQL